MMKLEKTEKLFRFMEIKEKLEKGEILKKKKLSEKYGVSEKSIQRDFDTLNTYYTEKNQSKVVYNRQKEGYELQKNVNANVFTNEEILAISKILLESRAFCKEELEILLRKIANQAASSDSYKRIEKIIKNERFNYVQLQHGKPLLKSIWNLSKYITDRKIIEIEYTSNIGKKKFHAVKPLSIMFSEFYFYLIVFMVDKDDEIPIVFRIDRITEVRNTNKKFDIPYSSRFEDGEFRKRIQFMYSGKLHKVKFEYTGLKEVVLDRLPTAEIKKEENLENNVKKYTIWAEIYGKEGIKMWLRSQGKKVKILED